MILYVLAGPSFKFSSLPQYQQTTFLDSDVSDRIALSFFKELFKGKTFLEKAQGNPVRNVGIKKTRLLVLRERSKIKIKNTHNIISFILSIAILTKI